MNVEDLNIKSKCISQYSEIMTQTEFVDFVIEQCQSYHKSKVNSITDEEMYQMASDYVSKIRNPLNMTKIKLRQAYKNGHKAFKNKLLKQ